MQTSRVLPPTSRQNNFAPQIRLKHARHRPKSGASQAFFTLIR